MLALAASAIALLAGADARAQQAEKKEEPAAAKPRAAEVETLTVLGRRGTPVPLASVPSSLSVLDRDEFLDEQVSAPRIEDLLSRKIPGFNPTNNGVRQIRGRTAQVFVNGVPVNEQLNAAGGADLTVLPTDQLGSIEVARGASSAYGFGSPGGIIALNTPRATSEDFTMATRVRAGFNPYHAHRSAQLNLYQSFSQIRGAFDYHVGLSAGYDGLEYDADRDRAVGANSPTGLTFNSEETPYSAAGSFGYDLGDAGIVRFTGTYSRVNVLKAFTSDASGDQSRVASKIVRFEPGDSTFQNSYTLNLSYENADVLGSYLKVEVLQSKVYSEGHGFIFDLDVPIRTEQTNEYQGVRTSITTPLDALIPGGSVTYGIDVLRNRFFNPVYLEQTGALKTVFSPDTRLDTYAPYVQLDVPIGPFLLTGGARTEKYRGRVGTTDTSAAALDFERFLINGGSIDRFDLTLYNAGVTYTMESGMELYASYSQGSEISQLGRAARDAGAFDPLGPVASASRVDAQPAKSDQYELGMRGTRQNVEYGIAAFFTTSDLLSTLQTNPDDPLGPLIPLREEQEFYGVETSFTWRMNERWQVGGVFSWQEGKRDAPQGRRFISSRNVPPFLGSAYVEYSPRPWWRNTLGVDFRAKRDRFGRDEVEFGAEGRVPKETLLNFSAAFDLPVGELAIGVRNLLNEETFGTASEADTGNSFFYIPEQGTRLTISYSRTW